MARKIFGQVQHYDWGDTAFIPQLLNQPEDTKPWAELWLGTHPSAPSHLDSVDGPLLSDVTSNMTMLVKILSCSQPLSLQTHPTVQQAERGYAREESQGISLSDPRRMYKDTSDKPELLIALTDFHALCGFANIEDSINQLGELGWNEEADILDTSGIDGYLLWAFDQRTLPSNRQLLPGWMLQLLDQYPTDMSLRIVPLLHHVILRPGQAISLPAGNLHAYLHGAGLEVMKSSDNVVRAGMTSKHVDVAELQRIVDTTPREHPVVNPLRDGSTSVYPSPSPAFSVSRLSGGTLPASDNIRILFGEIWSPQREFGLLGAGETMTIHGDTWVCTQH